VDIFGAHLCVNFGSELAGGVDVPTFFETTFLLRGDCVSLPSLRSSTWLPDRWWNHLRSSRIARKTWAFCRGLGIGTW